MKKILFSIGIVLSLAMVTNAQTNSPTQNIFQTTVGYFTSFNTNYDSTFRDHNFKFWAGAVSIQGSTVIPLANTLGLSYDLYKPVNTNTATHLSLSVESETLDGGVAGTLIAQEFGGAFNVTYHDAQLSGFAHGLYTLRQGTSKEWYGAVIGFRIQKALTENTYAYTGLGVAIPRNEKRYELGIGVTF